MWSKYLSRDAYKLILVILVSSVLILDFSPTVRLVSAAPAGSFNYEFVVDSEGSTTINIVYTTKETSGSSWILVPKFSDWVNNTIKGAVTRWFLNDSENVAEGSFYFYEVLFFSFISDGAEFEMQFQYNMTTAAIIIEPDGIFYSPQIGFEKSNSLEATVDFPSGFKVNDALAFGNSSSYNPSPQARHMLFLTIFLKLKISCVSR